MLKISLRMRAAQALMLVALLVSLAPAQLAGAARGPADCAAARFNAAGAARWLAGCGKSDLRAGPEALARAAVLAHAGALGMRADGRDLRLLRVDATPAATHVRFDQVYQGVPVFGGQVLVQYGAAGDIQLINNHTLPNLHVDVTPVVDAAAATRTARAGVSGSAVIT